MPNGVLFSAPAPDCGLLAVLRQGFHRDDDPHVREDAAYSGPNGDRVRPNQRAPLRLLGMVRVDWQFVGVGRGPCPLVDDRVIVRALKARTRNGPAVRKRVPAVARRQNPAGPHGRVGVMRPGTTRPDNGEACQRHGKS